MSLSMIAAMGIIVMIILLALGMNIGLSMMIVGFAGYTYVVNPTAALGLLRQVPATQASNFNLSVIPLFVLMGNIAFNAGLSKGLFNASNKWLSRLPGGLACATIAACAGFGAISGSVVATAATMGTVSIPEMRKYGYADSLASGSISVGGTLGILIPPSTPFIIYGILSETSIGRLFAAGVFPGILTALLLTAVVVIQVKLNPSLAPKSAPVSWKERFVSLKGVIGIGILFLGTIGGMFAGIFTVNEAAAVGVVLAIILTLINGKFSVKMMNDVIKDTILTTAMVYVIIIGAAVFGNFLAITQMPMKLASFILGLNISRYLVLAIIVAIYFFLGAIMDGIPMMMLTVPIFLPVMNSLGFDNIWFGVLIVLVMMLGAITPPVGMTCYVIAGIAKDVPLTTIFRGSMPFIPALLLSIVLITIFPQIVLWLPSVLFPA